ncbi:MAG: LysR family transcriptional regulator [Adlercreutzia equolifaciens]
MEYVPELLVLAETLSYTETARRLHMSHSAVSRHVDAVERTLGFGYLIGRLVKWS